MTRRLRFRRVAAVVAALAIAGCGSTVNRPIQVAAETGGSAGGATANGTTNGTTPGGGSAVGSGGPTGTGPTAAAGGGTTGGAGTAGDPTATTTAPEAGGAVKTGPIQVGFMLTRASNAAAFGGSLPEAVDQRDIYNALVRSQNAKGGLSGRPIEAVFAETDSASNNFDADLAAACSTFLEDSQVEAVVGRIADLNDSLESCLHKRAIPHIAATPEGRDSQFLGQYPYLVNTMSLTLEQRTRLKVDYGLASGLLTPDDKIGIVFAGCSASVRSWEQDALPYFQSKGLNVASVFTTRCPQGASDAITEVGKVGNLVLQMRSANVNKLMFHSDELAALFVIANAAEAQGWRPTYYVSSLANTAVSGTQIPTAQRANVHGIGWSPASDVAKAQWPSPNPAAVQCLADLSAEGIVPQTPLDHINAFIICDSFSLFVDAVAAAGGRADGPSVVNAIKAMGTSHASAYTYDGSSSYGPGRLAGVATAYPYDYDGGCACFRYTGGAISVP